MESQLLTLLILAPIVAIGAVCLSCLLTKPEMIFGGLDFWISQHAPEWIYKPLIGCQYCVGGQWFLWLYILLSFRGAVTYYPELHVLFTLLTIFLVAPVTKFYFKYLDK